MFFFILILLCDIKMKDAWFLIKIIYNYDEN